MAKRRAGRKSWSYNAGERGRNWARAYQDMRSGKYYLEWFEEVLDPTGTPVQKRKRALLRDEVTGGATDDRDVAKARADRLAAEFANRSDPAPQQTSPRRTVASIINQYLKEATPKKGESKQDHDRRAAKMFKELFGHKHAEDLDRSDWDRFVHLRSSGQIGPKAARNRQAEYDLKFMIAVLTWAVGTKGSDGRLLSFNPWGGAQRKADGMLMPKEPRPVRPAMTDAIRAKLIEHAPNPQFTLALLLGRYTISRNSSIRQLRWSDVDLEAGTIRWRGESDKNNQSVVVPLLPEAIDALRSAPRGIGEAWVFPSATDPSQHTSRCTFQTWLRRAKKRAGVNVPGLGFHGEKRAGVRDQWFRDLDVKTKEALSRTSNQTLITVYDDVGLDEMKQAIARRQKLASAGNN